MFEVLYFILTIAFVLSFLGEIVTWGRAVMIVGFVCSSYFTGTLGHYWEDKEQEKRIDACEQAVELVDRLNNNMEWM
jgi:hypothetical protein